MGERKAWNKEEDQALLDIIQNKKIKKWSAVSKAMEIQFKILGRTGKQCRERWHNQLDPAIKNSEWTNEEEKTLFLNHDRFGNKWARISQQLEGRTDNCVKNHFYSTLRRAFRRLNKFVVDTKQRLSLKQVKPVMLSKLVAAGEDKFNKKLKLASEIIEKSTEIKNKLLPFSKQVENTAQDQIEMEKVVKQILLFSKSYKRKKSKKSKLSEDQNDDGFQQEQQMSIKDQSEKESSPPSASAAEIKLQQVKQPQYRNLFTFAPYQVIHQVKEKESVQVREFGAFQLIHRPQSKIIDQQHSVEFDMIKRASNYSNWSALLKLPSMHQRISQISMSHDAIGFDGPFSFGHKNLFGCNLEQL